MKPAPFEIARPASLAEAVALLRDNDGAAKVMAGGQSLGPMLNLRLAQPRLVVDITGIPELTRSERGADHLILGACVTTADIEDSRVGAEPLPMLAEVAGRIAYRAVRNRGTVGGSLCHADPAADWVTALAALGAEAVVAGERTQRRVPVGRFVTGAFETAVGPGEVLRAIRIPMPSPRARWGYCKVCRKAGEFALAIAAVFADAERDIFRAVLGATSGAPLVVDDASSIFGGARAPSPSAQLDETAAARLIAAHGRDSSAARLRLHLTALARAARQAGAP